MFNSSSTTKFKQYSTFRFPIKFLYGIINHLFFFLQEKYQNLLTNPYSRREEIFTAFCQEDWVISGEIQLLYIKRNFNLEDAKYNSGHVAFPGGKHESGETDQQTATREVHEEIGLELHDRKKFIFIGRLFDLPVYGPNAKVDFVVTSFSIYLIYKVQALLNNFFFSLKFIFKLFLKLLFLLYQ